MYNITHHFHDAKVLLAVDNAEKIEGEGQVVIAHTFCWLFNLFLFTSEEIQNRDISKKANLNFALNFTFITKQNKKIDETNNMNLTWIKNTDLTQIYIKSVKNTCIDLYGQRPDVLNILGLAEGILVLLWVCRNNRSVTTAYIVRLGAIYLFCLQTISFPKFKVICLSISRGILVLEIKSYFTCSLDRH